MKFKIAFSILLFFVFGCNSEMDSKESILVYKNLLLKNIYQMDLYKDSISISPCKFNLSDSERITLKKNQKFWSNGSSRKFVLEEINMKEKSIKIKYHRVVTIYDDPKLKKGEFKIYNSEIRSCDFWREKSISQKINN